MKLDDGLEHETEKQKYMKDLKKRTFSALDYTSFRYKHRPDYLKLKDEPQCGTWDAPMLAYFNKDSVKKALKIDPSVTEF